jgi:hypothetical protein
VLGAWAFLFTGACSGDVSSNSGAMVPVGTPCISSQEELTNFAGFDSNSVNVESGAKACSPGVCLVAYFRGRVTCPYGQAASPMPGASAVDPNIPASELCYTAGAPQDASHRVLVPVAPQLVNRPPDVAVYCSCRCGGPDPKGSYCACPTGYACQDLIDSGNPDFAGSYCIKAGTAVKDVRALESGPSCSPSNVQPRPAGCGDLHPSG